MLLALFVAAAGGLGLGGSHISAQDSGPQATISVQETEIADLQGTISARGEKINAQRTQIADQKTEIANLEGQLPSTATPTPELSGKDAYTWLADPREITSRLFNHLGENYVFCGTVLTIYVAAPGEKYYLGDSEEQPFTTMAQVYPDGLFEPFMVGFDGDPAGIYEDSYVCVWGTLIDTQSFDNRMGGQNVNPLFDAEYFELA